MVGGTLDPLEFAQVPVMVRGFTGGTETDLVVPRTYDMGIASARCFHAAGQNMSSSS